MPSRASIPSFPPKDTSGNGLSSGAASQLQVLPPSACKVYTPRNLAEAMIRAIRPQPNDLWLDPCVGPGAFVAALRQSGVRKEQIVAIDIERDVGPVDASATTIRGVDFLHWCSSTPKRFTKIIANPPYVALSKLGPTLKENVKRLGDDADSSFTLRSNYWCAFLAASLRALKPAGSLAFVLPAAWEYALYAQDLREKILRSFRDVEVHRSREPLFADVSEGSIVLLARGFKQQPSTAVRFDHHSATRLVSALKPSRHKPKHSLLFSTRGEATGTTFKDLFTVSIGCVTGDVKFFLLTDEQRREFDLPSSALKPVLSRARHLLSAQIGKQQWERLRKANERVWLFSAGSDSLPGKAVRKYIRLGEKQCNLDGYKLSSRDPWHEVPGIRFGIGFMSGMTSKGPWLALRSMRGLVATNTLYIVTSTRVMSTDERAAWGLSLLSSYTRRQVRSRARRYPDGLIKLEPHDVSSLRLLSPKRIHGSLEIYQQAIQLLLSGDLASATALANASVATLSRKVARRQ